MNGRLLGRVVCALLVAAATAVALDFSLGPAVGYTSARGFADNEFGGGHYSTADSWLPFYVGLRTNLNAGPNNLTAAAYMLPPFTGTARVLDIADPAIQARDFGVETEYRRYFGAAGVQPLAYAEGRWGRSVVEYTPPPFDTRIVSHSILAAGGGGGAFSRWFLPTEFRGGFAYRVFKGDPGDGWSTHDKNYLLCFNAGFAKTVTSWLRLGAHAEMLTEVTHFTELNLNHRELRFAGGPEFLIVPTATKK